MLGGVGRLVKYRVHLQIKTQDRDVGGRGDLLGARRLWSQLLMTNVLCLLRWTVCHVCGASAQSRSTDERVCMGGINSRAYTGTVAQRLTALAVVQLQKDLQLGSKCVLNEAVAKVVLEVARRAEIRVLRQSSEERRVQREERRAQGSHVEWQKRR